jgi:dihydroflavonol-4-reductase
VLLTGGTGIVGNAIATELVRRGRPVRALVRSLERGRALLPSACELVQGDVTDRASVTRAVAGCRAVYHAAGLPEQWLPDPREFERVNVEGTRLVAEAALAAKAARFVYTSTIDVFAWTAGTPFDESTIDRAPKPTHYERSKQAADRIVTGLLDRGLPAVFLHPSALYGPVPAASPGLNAFIADLARGKIPMLLPGGMPVVHAAIGQRFILSDAYWELVAIARAVAECTGATVPRVMPAAVARGVSVVGEAIAAVIRKPPLIPSGQLAFLRSWARPDASRARRELGWTPRSFRDALPETIAFVTR